MTLAAGQRLGRYLLLAPLGRGAQATVWRAHDERLQREVALKLFNTAPGSPDDTQPVGEWLQEARATSRLAHPHIVPVFDAEKIQGRASLVFELVPGGTLADLLKRRRRLPAREAVELMLGVVDGLRAAHAQGIVHRDLKPSNILVDGDGRARVMDFGIAARLDAAAPDLLAGCIVGSPGYLSPEAAAAAAPSAQMDVFAAGLVLGELLCGQRLQPEREPKAALRKVIGEDLLLPDDADADDRLRAIVQRAIARKPDERYDSAASLRDALMQWLAPPEEAGTATGHGTLDFLLRRMRHKSDFPALSGHVVRIQRMASSDSDSLHTLADEILKDVALTQRLLRMVNSVHYRRNGHGVATVSRAVALVGLAGIRNMALSLVLVEHMKDKAHAQRLKEEFLRSMLAAQVAHALSGGARDAEEAFLGAMFYNLGKLLTEYYFPDEADAIRAQLRLTPSAGDALTHGDVLADKAAQVVLGLGFEGLGMGVARHWSLPDSLQRCMRRPDGPAPGHPQAGLERLRWLSIAANEVSDAIWHADEAQLAQRLERVAHHHGRSLGLTLAALRRAVDEARSQLVGVTPAMGLALARGSRGQQVLDAAAEATTALVPGVDLGGGVVGSVAGSGAGGVGVGVAVGGDAPGAATADAVARQRLAATAVLLDGAARRVPPSTAALPSAIGDALAAGIQDITDTLTGDSFKVNEVLRMVLETMYRAFGFQRMVFCLRDPATGRLNGRFGLGDRAAALCPLFQVLLRWPAHQAPDLFGAVCLKGSDTLIADARVPAIARRLPAWYRQQVDAPSFLLLPMLMKRAPFALIYADQARAGALQVGERELTLLRTLRNQAVMAFQQATAQG